MSIRRIVPNLRAGRLDENEEFYAGVLGLKLVMALDWIATFQSPDNSTAQVSVVYGDEPARITPQITVEVDDIEQVYERALAQGVEIVYRLTDEPWGVRRFFALDPNGQVVNVMSHPT